MIKSLRHVGIRVTNMEESRAFYEKVLECKVVYDDYEVWDHQALHIVKLKPRNGTALIELVDGNWKNHIALSVDDLSHWEKLTGLRAKKTEAGTKVLFILAPEGTRIELVEEPNNDKTSPNPVHYSRDRTES